MSAPQPWGVRLERVGEAVIVVPTGPLDASGTGRLREILRSREDSYRLVVLDLREVGSLEPEGVELLEQEQARLRAEGFEIVVVAGPVARAQLAEHEFALLDDPGEALAPHRPTGR